MKLLCAEYNEAGEVAYNVIGDNALLRNNDDFYIPAFATELSCVPQIVLRVGKIGKHVAERFAGRYYEEVGVGIRFYADNLERIVGGFFVSYGGNGFWFFGGNFTDEIIGGRLAGRYDLFIWIERWERSHT